MTEHEIIRHIDEGANFYLDFFANAQHMERVDTGHYCFTRPLPGNHGIVFAYNVRVEGLPKKEQRKKIREIKRLKMPIWWNLQSSEALYRLIHKKPKKNVSFASDDGDELYMAVTTPEQIPSANFSDGARAKEVDSADVFAVWANFANNYLYGGYQDIHPQHHFHACQSGIMICYLAYKDGKPVASCAILNNVGICSLEFVATHPDYRRQGLAKALCAKAMKSAFNSGASFISVRADAPGTRELYTSLGFKIYNHAL